MKRNQTRSKIHWRMKNKIQFVHSRIDLLDKLYKRLSPPKSNNHSHTQYKKKIPNLNNDWPRKLYIGSYCPKNRFLMNMMSIVPQLNSNTFLMSKWYKKDFLPRNKNP